MNKIKKIFGKFVFIICGILLALILIESSLRIAGFTILKYQQYKNEKVLKNKSQYNVMCIGESTTDRQYPVALQQILDSKYPGKFSVIDCGIYGIYLAGILTRLDNNIQQYKPDIAICMMGANNGFLDKEFRSRNEQKKQNGIFEKIKTYKLYKLLKQYIASLSGMTKIYADDFAADSKENHLIQKAEYFYSIKDYEKSVEILKNILKTYPDNETAFAYLTEIYFYNMPEFKDTGYEMALKSLKSGRIFERATLYQKVIIYNVEKNNIQLAKRFIDELLTEQTIEFDMMLYESIKDFITPGQKEQILKRTSRKKADLFYGLKALESMENKEFKKAEEFFNAAEELRMNFPNEETSQLYRLIVQKLIDNNIKVICMQYPVRNIKSLQNILKNETYYAKITFLSNEQIFKQALKESTRNKIFFDECSGDFGHCTDYGNSLIAENAARTLIKITQQND